MTDKDIIFKYLDQSELATAAPESFSYIGWEGDGYMAFYLFAEDYHKGAETLYEKMKSCGQRNDILDGLIYPLIFSHRHFCELMLKGIYFEFSKEPEENLKKFMNRCGHDLMRIWSEVKPILSRGKKHVGSIVNIGALEHYLRELNNYDPDSMAMRYPITKNLDKIREGWQHIDFHNFHVKMNDLYSALNQIRYDISNQAVINHTDKEMEDFVRAVETNLPKLRELVVILLPLAEKEKSKKEGRIKSQLFQVIEGKAVFSPPKRPDIKYIFNNGNDFLIIVEVLCYCGRHIISREVNVSKNTEESKKEFICVCIDEMHRNNFEFGKEPEENNINIDSKSSSAILKYLTLSLQLLSITI